MNSTLKKLLKPLASLYLTVPLLLLSMLLIYGGTTVQKQLSILDVQKQFFHSWFARIPFDAALRPFASADSPPVFDFTIFGQHIGGFWTFGGYSLIALLLANLLAAHSVRFKLNWKRSGIIAIHLGLIILLVGEIFSSSFAVESQMMIDQGQTASFTYDLRHVELAITEPSPSGTDKVTVIDSSALKPGAVLRAPGLPFEIKVEDYFPNSALAGPMQRASGAVGKATAGNNQSLKVVPENKVAGTEEEQDVASAFVTIQSGGRNLGTYLLSQWTNPQFNRPKMSPYFGVIDPQLQTVQVDGKTYQLDLRYRRYYKPYRVTLLKFSHDVYPGTDVPRNFASRIRLVDPTRHVDREVLIWMNHPLTYPSLRGETFYQQNFLPGDQTTILQVTHNSFWPLPYVGLGLGLLGMLVHFGMHLTGFLRRQRTSRLTPPAIPSRRSGNRAYSPAESRSGELSLTNYTLKPRSNLAGWLCALLAGTLCLIVCIFALSSSTPPENGFDLDTFSKLPVNFGGRPMPMDTLARIGLKVISGRESFDDGQGNRQPAIRWLADTISNVSNANSYQVIRIDYPDIVSQLGLNASEKYFSLDDLLARKDVVQKQFDLAIQIPEKQRDPYQKHIVELAQHVEQYLEIEQASRLLLVPPPHDGDPAWLPMVTKTGLSRGAGPIVEIIKYYHDDQPREFNNAVQSYHATLDRQLPATMRAVNFEVFFNHAGPFFWSMWLYVIVFTLACCSWLGLRKPLWSAAMGALIAIAAYHTFGIASRVYLTGWGPVTNLYSSAVFIGWAVVLLCIGLEIIYRNGVGAAVAAIIGFGTLVIAYFLGLDGDTMKPIVAVLMTKFWLWTHVPCVTLGYASTLLAAVLAIAYVVLGLFTHMLEKSNATPLARGLFAVAGGPMASLATRPIGSDDTIGKSLSRAVYAITCFAILFSFVGTILGGIWADFSWGRFWGWDPKENGAILIVLWNAIILHARWSGMVRQRGMMVLAILGIIVTSWSWFGTNLLGIGLHSYGFMEGWAFTLVCGWGVTLLFVAMGLIPLRLWRSFAAADDGLAVTRR